MSSLAAIRAILVADADVYATVGERIGPDHFDQSSEMPAIAMWHISGTAYDCMDGGLGFERAVFQITLHGTALRSEEVPVEEWMWGLVSESNGTQLAASMR